MSEHARVQVPTLLADNCAFFARAGSFCHNCGNSPVLVGSMAMQGPRLAPSMTHDIITGLSRLFTQAGE